MSGSQNPNLAFNREKWDAGGNVKPLNLVRNSHWNPYLQFPLAALGFTLAVFVPLLLWITPPSITPDTNAFLSGDQRNLESYEKVMDILKQDVVVAISVGGFNVFSPEGMQTIREISNAFYIQEDLVDVKSFTHSVKPVRQGFTFSMVPLVSSSPDQEELMKLKEYSLENPLIRNVMVSSDAQNTILLNTYNTDLQTPEDRSTFSQEIESILEPFRERGLKIHTLGLPLIEHEVRETLKRDLAKFIPAAAIVVTGILLLAFKSILVTLICLINLFLSLLLVPLILQFLGFPVTVYTLLLIPLITAIHLSLQVHLMNGLKTAFKEGYAGKDAVIEMLAQVYRPSAFALLTTMVGISSLLLSEVDQVRDFGSLGVMGIAGIYFMSFGPGLSVLTLCSKRKWLYPKSQKSTVEPESNNHRLCDWVLSHRKPILIVACLAMLGSIAGLVHVRTDVRAVEFLSPASPTRQAVEALDDIYGGVNVVQLEFDTGSQNGINNLDFLDWMNSIQSFAASQEEISGAYSYPQLLAMMNQVWEGEKPGSFKIPNSPLLMNIFVLALKTQNLPFLTALCDPDFQKAYLILRTRDMPSDLYLNVFNRVVDQARASAPDHVTIKAADGIHSILEADRRIMRTQLESAGTTVAFILAVLIAIWKSPRLSGISMTSNLIAVGLVLSVMSLLRIPLNSITIMVGAIALGVAVDDSVHFISHWKSERQKGMDVGEALRRTYVVKTRPIFASSMVLAGVFLLFTVSSFPPIRQFGILCTASFILALASALFLIPAMIRDTEGRNESDTKP